MNSNKIEGDKSTKIIDVLLLFALDGPFIVLAFLNSYIVHIKTRFRDLSKGLAII